MPISQTSISNREAMLSRNLYQPEDPYSINQNLLTQTLDAFQAAGFNMRSNLSIGIAERVVQNTPLVRDGAVRLAVEMGRRLAANLFYENVGTLDIDAAFSKDPNRTVITKHVNMSITPRLKTGTIGDVIKSGLGISRPNTVLDVSYKNGTSTDKERELGGKNMYLNLGSGQKAYLQEQQSQNFYNNHPIANSELGGKYSINNDLYNFAELLKVRDGTKYSSYILDRTKNKNDDTFNNETNSLQQTMELHESRLNILEDEGFGATDLGFSSDGLSDEVRFLQYSKDGIRSNSEFGVKRGLVYYTQQIAKTNTLVGKMLRGDTKEYESKDGGNVQWKGSRACRSFTMSEQYGSFGPNGNLMRFEGNKNSGSVISKSVMPRIYPVTENDKRTMMLSFENLAWGKSETSKLVSNEQGPNNGRIMWFPPFGLTISETESPKWDKTPFLGRIEPVYGYSGTERKAVMSFAILIDCPPQVDDFNTASKKMTLGAFFAGCEDQQIKNSSVGLNEAKIKTSEPPLANIQNFSGSLPALYFDNDSDTYDLNYEMTGSEKNNIPQGPDFKNSYSLNAPFNSDIVGVARWMATQYNDKLFDYSINVNIDASSSSLFTRDYNMQLSFRRAHELMIQTLALFNLEASTSLTLVSPHAEKSDYSKTITSLNVGKKISFTTTDNRIKFTISGSGEKYNGTNSGTSEASQINNKASKLVRKVSLKSMTAKSTVKLDDLKANNPTNTELKNQAANTSTLKGKNSKDAASIRFSEGGSSGFRFPSGWDKLDYYKPVYHSQTPYDFYKRYTFLHQLTRPGPTVEVGTGVGSNSLFGRMPICVLRMGDFFHTKVAINSISFDMSNTTWDLNPEGMGMQPMYCKITIDMDIIGGMSLEGPVNRLQNAIDNNFIANSTFYDNLGYYPQSRRDFGVIPPINPLTAKK